MLGAEIPESQRVDGVILAGEHLIKGWSNTQSVIALSSGET